MYREKNLKNGWRKKKKKKKEKKKRRTDTRSPCLAKTKGEAQGDHDEQW